MAKFVQKSQKFDNLLLKKDENFQNLSKSDENLL